VGIRPRNRVKRAFAAEAAIWHPPKCIVMALYNAFEPSEVLAEMNNFYAVTSLNRARFMLHVTGASNKGHSGLAGH
jgi:hypothetical protein